MLASKKRTTQHEATEGAVQATRLSRALSLAQISQRWAGGREDEGRRGGKAAASSRRAAGRYSRIAAREPGALKGGGYGITRGGLGAGGRESRRSPSPTLPPRLGDPQQRSGSDCSHRQTPSGGLAASQARAPTPLRLRRTAPPPRGCDDAAPPACLTQTYLKVAHRKAAGPSAEVDEVEGERGGTWCWLITLL